MIVIKSMGTFWCIKLSSISWEVIAHCTCCCCISRRENWIYENSVQYSNLLFFSNSCQYYCRVAGPSLDNYDKQALPVVCRLSSAAVCVLVASAAAAVSHSKIFDVWLTELWADGGGSWLPPSQWTSVFFRTKLKIITNTETVLLAQYNSDSKMLVKIYTLVSSRDLT